MHVSAKLFYWLKNVNPTTTVKTTINHLTNKLTFRTLSYLYLKKKKIIHKYILCVFVVNIVCKICLFWKQFFSP